MNEYVYKHRMLNICKIIQYDTNHKHLNIICKSKYIYIYICTARERDRDINICIYIYMILLISAYTTLENTDFTIATEIVKKHE